ncbi:MAG TPA: SDR family oxidoreductase [Acidimicrobiales bacterium]|nr:SDR family oxidoreductase [Acidimicrobiales bacterium]
MSEPVYDFSERVVVVTGGSRGVGAEIVRRFVDAGAHVVTCGRHEAEAEGAVFMTADVRKPADAEKVVAKAVEHFGRLDVLVNNAGGAPHAMAADMSPRFVEAVINLNLLAPLWCAQSAHKVMAVQEDGGCIVNVTSVSGMRPSPGASAYGAAKAGLINLTTTLAVEWAPLVRLNCVTAGLLDTGAGEEFYGGAEGMERVAATVPLGRMGIPADVASAVMWLASPGSSYVSGANLVLHGGGEWPAYLVAAGATGSADSGG